MLYQILLGAATYCVGAGALSWWLGGIFKRERAMLGLTVEQLRESQEWIAAHRATEPQDVAPALADVIVSQDSAHFVGSAHRYTA